MLLNGRKSGKDFIVIATAKAENRNTHINRNVTFVDSTYDVQL